MAGRRVVITGLGVISSIGTGKAGFQDALFKGSSGIKPITLFDTSGFKVKNAGEITDFSPENILGSKGLRTLDRSTKLLLCATKLAQEDARLQINEGNCSDIGVAVGTALGSIKSISDFDREAITDGPRYVNPALFPNTVINSPASQVSIRFNIKGFNTTVSTGFCASLDAINYAADFIRLGRVRAVFCGGVEEMCVQTFLAFYKTGCLAGLKEASLELSCPFDKRRNGVIFGEGVSIFVLEDLDSALERKARIYAEILGSGMAFGEGGLKKAIQAAMRKSGRSPQDIDCIFAGANSSVQEDLYEARAIKEVFSENARDVSVSCVKSMLGECYSASGALQLASAVCAIERQSIPPTINYQEEDPACGLRVAANQAQEAKINNVLINNFSKSRQNSSLIISKFVNYSATQN